MKKIDFKNCLIMMIDIGFVYYAFLFASLLLHDFRMHDEIETVIQSFIWLLPLYVLIFILFKLYVSVWEYASIEEALNVFLAVVIGFILVNLIRISFNLSLQPNLLILSHIILFLLLIGVRYIYRLKNCFIHLLNRDENRIRTLVIGAGSASNLLIKELNGNKAILNHVICLVDDDIKKLGKMIHGVKVVGTTRQLKYLVFKYKIEEIIVSIPSASQFEFQSILKSCEDLTIKVKVFPPFYQLINEDCLNFSVNKIREVEIVDLLGRDEVMIDNLGLLDFLSDEVIFVSGGGGSIGSELCRQIVKFHPKKIIIFDQYENNAYEIQNELLRDIEKLDVKPDIEVLIGSVQDEFRLIEIFSMYSISVIFHAAAHKHVPLMEVSPKEAIKNNVYGTYTIAKLAHEYKVKKFVLISSDKAVNPTNIMGATKRLSEMIINAFNGISLTHYAAVRFGNVLGSNGSVVPLFKKQIKNGGPVTVTHKEVIRYFMTISEAVSLVLQAGAYARGGEIFVLDMGKPMKILELAENLIRLSGYEPYRDINILITGLRPGDKLYEELLMADENLQETKHEKIYFLRQKLIYLDQIEDYLEELNYALTLQNVNIPQVISKLIPTYRNLSMKEGIV
ncbi:polysaccharide biosynthesis protein [Mycoplasmatota bacterium]|nr:polysaccharide biosynthesis protein [Mycoplasmatota bacterium]